MNFKINPVIPTPFTPIEIELTLESEEELNEFYGRLGMPHDLIMEYWMEQDEPIEKMNKEDDPFFDLWDELDDIKQMLKGEEE